MPQLRFLQTFAALSFAAVVLAVAALPAGARMGARSGRRMLRAADFVLIGGLVGCVAWGMASGEWAVFWQDLGLDAVIQIGAFVAMVYFTGRNFVSRYLDDKAASERKEGAADA